MTLAPDPTRVARRAVALNLDLAQGRHGATARLELHDRDGRRVALLALRGWLDGPAVIRLESAIEDVSARGACQLLLDCSQLRHLDYRAAPRLVAALEQFESRAGGFVLCGLSPYLRDLFRLAGCERALRCWPSATDLLESAGGSARESAS